jgi:signal peptidase I
MLDNDPISGWPEDEGAAAGDGRPRRHFDPLFAWEDPTDGEPHRLAASGETDFLAYTWEDTGASPAWEALSAARESWAMPAAPGKPTGWYATRWHEAHATQLTEAQVRLRAGVITVPRPARRWTVTVRELAETLLLALLIFLSVRASFQNFRVEGASMQPSLENGEYLIVNKLSYAQLDLSIFNFLPFYDAGDDPVTHLWGKPERGDIIVFRAPTSPNRDFIKRIIGLPGDTIQITREGRVMLNGRLLSEPYIAGTTNCIDPDCPAIDIPLEGSPEAHAECGSYACYFVMGDNRQNSSDSRQGWFVPEENIIGKALITYWHQGGPEFNVAPNHSVSADEATD